MDGIDRGARDGSEPGGVCGRVRTESGARQEGMLVDVVGRVCEEGVTEGSSQGGASGQSCRKTEGRSNTPQSAVSLPILIYSLVFSTHLRHHVSAGAIYWRPHIVTIRVFSIYCQHTRASLRRAHTPLPPHPSISHRWNWKNCCAAEALVQKETPRS